jgi:protease I
MKVLIPLPSKDFDPTEAGVSFKILVENGIDVTIATPNGKQAIPDLLMLKGIKLGLFKSSLMADKNGQAGYYFMEQSSTFKNPISYNEINPESFDGILLPGGHDKGMREYLESTVLQSKIKLFYELNKKMAAICHGVILLARTKSNNHDSIIADYQVTSLLKKQERLAYYLTKWYLADYYLTYPTTVEDEVISILKSPSQFKHGNGGNTYLGISLLKRDSLNQLERGFTVEDRNIITARWPGDVHQFSTRFVKLLKNS